MVLWLSSYDQSFLVTVIPQLKQPLPGTNIITTTLGYTWSIVGFLACSALLRSLDIDILIRYNNQDCHIK